jgi:hypothetical protein
MLTQLLEASILILLNFLTAYFFQSLYRIMLMDLKSPCTNLWKSASSVFVTIRDQCSRNNLALSNSSTEEQKFITEYLGALLSSVIDFLKKSTALRTTLSKMSFCRNDVLLLLMQVPLQGVIFIFGFLRHAVSPSPSLFPVGRDNRRRECE